MFCTSVAALFALGLVTATAQGAVQAPKYDGKITLTKLSGAKCNALPIKKDDQFNAIYRVKVRPTGAPEVLQIQIPLGTIWAVADSKGDRTFRGPQSNVTGTIIFDTVIFPIPKGTKAKLTSVPAAPDDGTTKIVLTGTFSNFLISGCTAKIRGEFFKR